MRKTSVYLDDEDARRLAQLADAEGRSRAEVLRRAIRSYVARPRGERGFALDGVGDGPGGSVAELSEESLLEGFGS